MKGLKYVKWIAAFLVLVVVACVILLVVDKNTQSQVSTVTQEVEYIDLETPTDEQLNNGKLNICLVTKGYDNDYWDTLIQGAVDSADENGINLYVTGVRQVKILECLSLSMLMILNITMTNMVI